MLWFFIGEQLDEHHNLGGQAVTNSPRVLGVQGGVIAQDIAVSVCTNAPVCVCQNEPVEHFGDGCVANQTRGTISMADTLQQLRIPCHRSRHAVACYG